MSLLKLISVLILGCTLFACSPAEKSKDSTLQSQNTNENSDAGPNDSPDIDGLPEIPDGDTEVLEGVTISSKAELDAALSSASGGEVFLLKAGNYGSLNLSNKSYSSKVIVSSDDRNDPAVFSRVEIENVKYFRLDSVEIANPGNGGGGSGIVEISSSQQVDLTNSEIHGLVDDVYVGFYGVYVFDNSSSILIHNNSLHDIADGLVSFSSTKLTFSENTIEDIQCDGMKFGSVSEVLIENNTGPRRRHPQPGDHKDFIQFQASSSDVIVRGNVSLPQYEIVNQGLFVNDGTYFNFTVENNIFYVGNLRGISIGDTGEAAGGNHIIRNNTILTPPTWGEKAAYITTINDTNVTMENNVVAYNNNQAGISGSNHKIEYDVSGNSLHYSKYYKNAMRGAGITIEDLEPVKGSPADGQVGAYSRIYELLGK